MKVENREALQAGTVLGDTGVWNGMNVKWQAALKAGTVLDATEKHIDPDFGDSLLAKTEQTAR